VQKVDITQLQSQINDLRADVSSRELSNSKINNQITAIDSQIGSANHEIDLAVKAIETLDRIASVNRQAIKTQFVDAINSALKVVFGDQLTIDMEWTIKRSRPNLTFYLVTPNARREITPTGSGMGGGVMDLIALVLRIMFQVVRPQGLRRISFLDEPLRMLDRESQTKAAQFLSSICEQLDWTMVLVSHSEEIISEADRCYKVEYQNGKSVVKMA
jgi:DNA repair exonuclease SbcCD ATPase subunit